jgi:hypothetical protein
MGAEGTIYYSYLLRMWQVPINDERTWRIQLENVQTGEKSGFASLENLLIYLNQVVTGQDNPSGEGSQSEVQGLGDSPAPPNPSSPVERRTTC